MIWENGSKSLPDIGELFGGLDYAAVAQRIRRTTSTYNSISIADGHHDDGRRFVVHADDNLSAFPESETTVCIHLVGQRMLTNESERTLQASRCTSEMN